MINVAIVSPLDLQLDERNPRFRINLHPSQIEIRQYLLDHEDTLTLAKRIVRMDTIMPGERMIVFKENDHMVVLEGNRRATVYQMLLDRSLIPDDYKKRVPTASKKLLAEIASISVDLVDNRQEAMPYLAARHIQGVKQWSSYSKWHVSFEMFQDGMSIDEISEHLPGSGDITRNIKSYKILLRVMNDQNWTSIEKKLIDPLRLKPDQLIRLFFSRNTVPELGLRYDDQYNLSSTKMSDTDFDALLHVLARKAFIDKTIGTRTNFYDSVVQEAIAPFLRKDGGKNGTANQDSEESSEFHDSPTDGVRSQSDTTASGSPQMEPDAEGSSTEKQPDAHQKDEKASPRGSGKAQLPYFFDGLNISKLNRNDSDGRV